MKQAYLFIVYEDFSCESYHFDGKDWGSAYIYKNPRVAKNRCLELMRSGVLCEAIGEISLDSERAAHSVACAMDRISHKASGEQLPT